MTNEREHQIKTFLAKAGWSDADRKTLAGDASFRRYDRLAGSMGRAVLMDAPPQRRTFVHLCKWLAF